MIPLLSKSSTTSILCVPQLARRSTITCILMQWNPQRVPVSVLPSAAMAASGKRYVTLTPTSTAKSRPSARTFIPNRKAYKLKTHSCWSLLKSTKAQPTGVKGNSTTCSVDTNLNMTADSPSTSTQQRE